eukprot:UN24137
MCQNYFIQLLLALTGRMNPLQELGGEEKKNSVKFVEKINDCIIKVITKTDKKTSGIRALGLWIMADYKHGVSVANNEEVLNFLVATANDKTKTEYKYSAECLALCIGNPAIRKAILDVEQHIMFIWLLNEDDYSIRVNGALALAKLSAVHEESRLMALREFQALECLKPVLFYFLKNINKTELPNIVLNALECLSYFSLHIEVKLYLLDPIKRAKKEYETYLNYILPYVKSDKRAVRHGILQILLNLSLSEEDKLMAQSEKEDALRKLQKVAERGLPHKATEEHEKLAKRAGKRYHVKKIRSQLIRLNSIQTMHDIVKAYKKEHQTLREKNTKNSDQKFDEK